MIEHIAALISSFAWPVTLLTIVLLFRREFRGAAGRLKSLAYKEFRAEFEKDMEVLQAEVKELPEEPKIRQIEQGEQRQVTTDEDVLTRLVEISPRAAIMEAWRNIEVTTKQVAAAHGVTLTGNIAGVKAIQEIVKRGLLPQQVIPVYERMRKIRSSAAHAEDFTIERPAAEQYVEMARALYQSLDALVEDYTK